MKNLRETLSSDRGGALVIVALVLPILVLLAAGGVASFSLYATEGEMQTAADQSALAGAASLPPVDPSLLTSSTLFPLPGTDTLYSLSPVALPRIGELIPDPRAVSCAVGADALSPQSAALVSSLGDPSAFTVPTEPGGGARTTVCSDNRVYPTIQPNPNTSTAVDCANELVSKVANLNLPSGIGGPISTIQSTVNSVAKINLNHLLPAAFTPRMHVDVYSWVQPPLLSMFTDNTGATMHTSATAVRRIKNAIVVPIVPAQKLRIDLGVARPVEVITDPVNLNNAIRTPQKPLLDAIDEADNRLNAVMSSQGLPCHNLLHNTRQDLRDIYDPPTGPAPSALDIAQTTVDSAKSAASRTGIPSPDVNNPTSLAGEAVLLIGVTTDALGRPVAATQIPILDSTLVVLSKTATGDFKAATISAANAWGVFRSSLVR